MLDCRKFLANHDTDRYCISLFFPKKIQESFFGLTCFDLELNAIDSKLQDPIIKKIRYQWWREALLQFQKNKISPHPLIQYFQHYQIPIQPMLQRLDERELWIIYTTLNDLILRANQITFYYQSLHIQSESIFAYSLIRQIRDIFFKASCGKIILHKNLLHQFNIKEKQFISGEMDKTLENFLLHIRNFLDHLIKIDLLQGYFGKTYIHYRNKLNRIENFYHPQFFNSCPKLIFRLTLNKLLKI